MEELIEFLRYIKEIRIRKNISLTEVSQKTRINIKFLEHLEKGEIEFLPQIYIHMFIKSFARAVGVSEKEIMDQYLLIKAHASQETSGEGEQEDEEEKYPPQGTTVAYHDEEKGSIFQNPTLRVLAVAIPIVGMLVYIGNRFNQERGSFEVANIKVTNEEKAAVSQQKEEIATTPQQQAQPLTLTAQFSERTWLRITLDAANSNEYNFNAGDRVEWKADSSFSLRIGRAHAIRLYLNGRDLGQLGPATALVWAVVINRGGIASKELRTRTDITSQPAQGSRPQSANP